MSHKLTDNEHDSLKLSVLEQAGVDNWIGYSAVGAVYDYEDYLYGLDDDQTPLSFYGWLDKNNKSIDDWL
jgi:hypothetical protein